jgi:hypothetical protein
MLKQIGVRLEEELIKITKQYALDNQKSIQEVFTVALESYFANKLTSEHDNKLESEQVNKITPNYFYDEDEEPTTKSLSVLDQIKGISEAYLGTEEPVSGVTAMLKDSDYYPNPLEQEYDYILRKTAKTGKPEKHYQQYQSGPIFWMTPEGCKGHFDADGNRIPFRYTDEKGKVVEPDDDEMAELIEAYGSNIKVEE